MNHGHVVPNPDGTRARCGGPGICSDCSIEQAEHDKVYSSAPQGAKPMASNEDFANKILSGFSWTPMHGGNPLKRVASVVAEVRRDERARILALLRSEEAKDQDWFDGQSKACADFLESQLENVADKKQSEALK